MARITGIDLPANKRIEAALPYIYGIGSVLAKKIITNCKIDANKKTKDLSDSLTKIGQAMYGKQQGPQGTPPPPPQEGEKKQDNKKGKKDVEEGEVVS